MWETPGRARHDDRGIPRPVWVSRAPACCTIRVGTSGACRTTCSPGYAGSVAWSGWTSRRSAQRGADDPVDPPGQGDVPVGHPAGRVGDAGERHGAPADVDVGVVVELLGGFGDPVHYPDRGHEAGQLDGTADRRAVVLPAVQP